MAIHFKIIRDGRKFFAEADGGARFFVGRETHFEGRDGLFNVPGSATPKLFYNSDDFRPSIGFWADFIAPTAKCEGGGNLVTLNTYDRAAFTWGFGQFAAHVPNGDFVRWFRAMLGQPRKDDYFPDLTLENGRIAHVSGTIKKVLESDDSTQPLMDYLNPTSNDVDDREVIAAAKLIHWTVAEQSVRELQVTEMRNTAKRIMVEADNRLGLDGKTADICCVCFDVRHQGRAKFKRLGEALASSNPLADLLTIGEPRYHERIVTLKAEIKARSALFASKRWKRATSAFV